MRRHLAALPLLLVAPTLAVAAPASASPADSPPAGPSVAADHSPRRAAAGRQVRLRTWDSAAQWRQGDRAGVRVRSGRLVLRNPVATTTYGGRRYELGHWTSPWAAPGFSFEELIASWSALTNRDTYISVSVRGRSAGGSTTSWDLLTRWKSGHRFLQRHSGPSQGDDGTTVNVDTWVTGGLAAYQFRVKLHRRAGTRAKPSVDAAYVMTSRVPDSAGATSRPGVAGGTVLKVPRYSQMVHNGHYPAWGGGGEAWCSPTSTSMVLGYYDALPAPRRYGWVPDGHPDPWVDYGARSTYDHAYEGTGNWPFNTAYAAPLAGKAFVTRLRSLREAEVLVRAGIPLVVSVAFGAGELDGAPISSSNGHLLVIVGFRENGAVVVNDPAASTRKGVRRTYRRAQLERVWLEASGGLTYVIRDGKHPLPAPGKHTNW